MENEGLCVYLRFRSSAGVATKQLASSSYIIGTQPAGTIPSGTATT
ncbi:MAG: hypothetical protein ABIG40_00350 [Parcubacteria group bacterium]